MFTYTYLRPKAGTMWYDFTTPDIYGLELLDLVEAAFPNRVFIGKCYLDDLKIIFEQELTPEEEIQLTDIVTNFEPIIQ